MHLASCRRFWRDIERSDAVEVSLLDTAEPLTLAQAKAHLQVDTVLTDDDTWITDAIVAVRQQVERDLNMTLRRANLLMTFDQFPVEPSIPLPRPPLISVTTLSSFDDDGTETTFSSTTGYDYDKYSMPGRIILRPNQTWPSDVRTRQGGKVTWIAGYAEGTIPVRAIQAMKLLLGHWYRNREAVGNEATTIYPLAYEALTSDRLVSFG